MPRATANHSNTEGVPPNAPGPDEETRPRTRGRVYRYSHTLAPYVPAPPPPRNRPPLPQSNARKRQGPKTINRAPDRNNPETETENVVPSANKADSVCGIPNNGNGTNIPSNTTSGTDPQSSSEGQLPSDVPAEFSEKISPHSVPSQAVPPVELPSAQGSELHGTTEVSETATEPQAAPLNSTHPFGSAWTRFDTYNDGSEVAPPTLVFNASAHHQLSSAQTSRSCEQNQQPKSRGPVPNSLEGNADPFAFNAPAQNSIPHGESGSSTHVLPLHHESHTSNFAALQSAMIQLLPPTFTQVQAPAPSAVLANISAVQAQYHPFQAHSGEMGAQEPYRAQSILALQEQSMTSEGSGSRESSVTPSSAQLSSTRQSTPFDSNQAGHHRSQRSIRQLDFPYEQVSLIRVLRRRWHFYLAAEDPFPISPLQALQACVQYAEDFFGAPCGTFRVPQSLLNHNIETSYGVNTETAEKVSALVQNLNFIYTGFDTETKKVTGRYRHPCITLVVQSLLFANMSRTKSLGVLFMQNIMEETPEAVCQEFYDRSANMGAPVATLALACTLILYGLHAIQAGDSSTRPTQSRKQLSFHETVYAARYRAILVKLKQYPCLGELRKAHMEDIMKDYIRIQSAKGLASDVDIDDEMVSDGE